MVEKRVVYNGELRSQEELDAHYKPVKKSFLKRILQHKIFYLMLLPCLIHYTVFSYWPMAGNILAFKEFGFNTGMFGGDWVGFKYFEQFFNDPRSMLYVRNTLVISSMKLFLYLPFPIMLALMFNEVKQPRLRDTLQTVTYLPYFISWVVVVGLMNALLAPNTGLLNQVIANLGGDGSKFWMMDRTLFYPLTFLSYLWKEVGWDSIIYFSAIVAISPSLFEAAAIDGAGKLRQMWHVTIPGIRGTIILLFIMSLGSILSAGFDQVFLMQNPGNADVSEIIDTYVVRTGLQGGQFGYSTAISLMQGLVGLVLTVIVNRIADKKFDSAVW